MFENYVSAKADRRATWPLPVATALVTIFCAVLIVRSFWIIEKLDPPDTEIGFNVAPPPPPPPPAGSKKPKTEKKVVKKVKEAVQPDPERKPEPVQEEEAPDDGVEGGVEGGVAGGVVGGVVGGVLEAAPPPPPEKPKQLPPQQVEQMRISGEKEIQPPNDVNVAIRRAGQKVIGVTQMCLSAQGTVSTVKMLKSTGFPGYDNKIKSKMREWRYRPFMVNGKAVPICSTVTFIYTPAS